MRPFVVGGEVWQVVTAQPGDPRLTDRTGHERLATTDPLTRSVYLNSSLRPPLLDRVLLHEVAHAVTISHGLLTTLRSKLPTDTWVHAEEWSAQLVENHAMEAVQAARRALGRPICVRGLCSD